MIIGPLAKRWRDRYDYYRFYGHTRFSAATLATNFWWFVVGGAAVGIILGAFVDQPWVR